MLESDFDSVSMRTTGSHGLFHAEGTQSNVYRQLEQLEDGKTRWVAVKIVSFLANESTKPHDVLKEAKLLLEEIQQPNVRFFGHRSRCDLIELTPRKLDHISLQIHSEPL
jgi:hypothetical protein